MRRRCGGDRHSLRRRPPFVAALWQALHGSPGAVQVPLFRPSCPALPQVAGLGAATAMEEAVVELQVSPCSEGRQEQPQEEQPPARGRQDPAAAARGSDQAEEAAAGGPAGGAPACAAAADAAASGPQASPASLPSHMLVTVPPAAERAAEQPVTAEPPRKRVRFSSDALEEAVPPSGGLAPAGGKQGMPALPPLPPQLAAAAHGLAAAGALGFGQQMLQHEAGMPEQDELLQLHALMAQAQQQQQRRQQPQQQAASPSLSPWLPQQAQYGTVAGARHAIGQLHATPVLRLEDVSQVGPATVCRAVLESLWHCSN